MFQTADGRFAVAPPQTEGGPYTVHPVRSDQEGFEYTDQAFQVNTLRDECSCAAIQGIGCDHKTAVDEYAAATAEQIITEAKPSPEVTKAATASHRPKYNRHQIGMTETTPSRPIWGTEIVCSCGWTFMPTQAFTKDEAKTMHREHREKEEANTPAPIFDTREAWLNEAMRHIHSRAALLGLGDNPPKTRVACGFTYGKGKRIGECWRKEQSGDGTFEIIIHNKLDDPLHVLECLVHEIGHTFMEQGTGHKAPFRRWAVTMGLAGPMTATTAGEELRLWLTELAATLGTFPHAALDSAQRIREGGPKKQTNRWVKWTCEIPDCGWIVRTAKPDFKGACLSPLHFDPDDPSRQTIGAFIPGFEVEPE
jgi:hypothetical protein